MLVEINGIEWQIIEVEEGNEHLKIGDDECYGTCRYDRQNIYLLKSMRLSMKKQTLIHELTHAFLYEILLKRQKSYDNEEICIFVSKYGERIINLANKYMEIKKYTKGC